MEGCQVRGCVVAGQQQAEPKQFHLLPGSCVDQGLFGFRRVRVSAAITRLPPHLEMFSNVGGIVVEEG